ncbi:MAG: XRE family transcriptional regulator [Ilumatobacteraceae bacterium]|nr:XRE family transcriptional regulator [Ilumatobacteraceae bacterium]
MSLDRDERWDEVGQAIRLLRLSQSLTLVELAVRADLSQPFLSQVENGRAKPSMSSLYRIATALDTTPQALFGGANSAAQPTLARTADATVPAIDTDGESLRRLLLPGGAPFHVVELVGLSTEFLEPWQHHGFEALYVLAGPIDVEVDGVCSTLATGDFLSYPAQLPHRYRSALGSEARVLLIESHHATESVVHGVPETP